MAQNAIEVEGLEKKFKTVVALDGIDFEVRTGTIFGLLGPNGAGKTTAIRILSTILRPDGGRAEVMGVDVLKNPAAVRCRIGLAGQNAAVDERLTGRENLKIVGKLGQVPTKEVIKRADALLNSFGLADAADRPLRTYSGGMRRRLDVAAALVQRPPVIFLDEPTTGLDIQSRQELWARIEELVAEGATVLLTTQYLEEADRLAGRIAVVDHGKVVANDTAAGLKSKLGTTVIEVGMPDEGTGARAQQVLSARLPGQLEPDGATVRIRSNAPTGDLFEVLRALDGEGLTPTTVAVHEPTLDDVFLTLTGRTCEGRGDGCENEGA